ncbi:hypothetical protein [Caenispirillum salinarum]|uniref:hypothetical protein n=1 Tax=Caenispirillum salinarum TaxID=859058 RepID=UPI0038509F48
MRLNEQEKRIILETSREFFGPDVIVRLFGSRTDDSRTGGDIDLHLTVDPERGAVRQQIQFAAQVEMRLGTEDQVDVVVHRRNDPLRLVDRIATDRGVLLQ